MKSGLIKGIGATAALALVLCAGFGAKALFPSFSASSQPQEPLSTVSEAVPEPEKDIEYTVISYYSPVYSQEELLEISSLVALGKVTEISPSFRVQGVGESGERVFTDYTVQLETIVRGKASQSVITVRMEGDPNNSYVIYEEAPLLEEGKEYLLFLQKSGMGGGCNTAGDYYYITSGRQGVYEPEETAMPLSDETAMNPVFVSQKKLLHMVCPENSVPYIAYKDTDEPGTPVNDEINNETLEWDTFQTMAEEANLTCPADDNVRRRMIEENLRGSMQNGFLSPEELEIALAEMDQYAEIVD